MSGIKLKSNILSIGFKSTKSNDHTPYDDDDDDNKSRISII